MSGLFKHAIWGSLIAALSFAPTASALMQASGPTIPVIDTTQPCKDRNVEACLDDAEGDPALIDAQKDVLTAPETFQPTCQLTFTPLVKGGTIWDVFGWYNVKPDPKTPGKFLKPLQAELYGMFVANDWKTTEQLAGQQEVLDLGVEAAAGRYKGGQIGFFLVSGAQTLTLNKETHAVTGNIEFRFFTQHSLNTGSTATSTFYNVLTWESVAKKNTFYFGWEDLPPGSPIDNDFDDFLFSVSGVQCGGGGQPCDTGLQGACADGVLQCKKGVIQCIQTLDSTPELCNALDDDCDGEVDNGDALCKDGEICNRGVCVPKCGTGEFRCPRGKECDSTGVCVESACKDFPCPAGKVCKAAACVDSCTDIVCPFGLACRNGGCVDPCIGIECDDGFACVQGICTSCECASCGDGSVCAASASSVGVKLCIETGCETKTCADHTHCSQGDCVDDCDGASCPAGQLCEKGECIADGTVTPGAGGAGSDDPGIVIITGGSISLGEDVNTSGSGATSGSSGGNNGRPVASDQKSCNCTVPGAPVSRTGALALLVGLAALARRRRHASGRAA